MSIAKEKCVTLSLVKVKSSRKFKHLRIFLLDFGDFPNKNVNENKLFFVIRKEEFRFLYSFYKVNPDDDIDNL